MQDIYHIRMQLLKDTHPPFIDQPSFHKIPPFLEIQDVPTFYRPIGKTKILNDSFK